MLLNKNVRAVLMDANMSVKPIEIVVTCRRGFQSKGTSHDSFKSTQIKLFMA